MTTLSRPSTPLFAVRGSRGWVRSGASAALVAAMAAACLPVLAQSGKSDRSQPMVMEADRSGSVDLQRQVQVYDGNAVISQGSMILRADRIEVRQTPDGYYAGQAVGGAGKPATWRQRRDAVNETVEGSAERIEFDGRADTLRFLGNGSVRRLRGGTVADEITGGVIVWDNAAEVFRVEGGAKSASNPGGRVRAVLSPPPEPPASAPGVATPGAPLVPSRALGEKK